MISNNLKQDQVANWLEFITLTLLFSKDYRALSILRRKFSRLTPNNFKTFTKHCLCQTSPGVCCPSLVTILQEDVKILELEERKATKLVKKFRNLDCLETLVNPTLQQ